MKNKFLRVMLIVAMAFTMMACNSASQEENVTGESGQKDSYSAVVDTETASDVESETATEHEVLGEGATTFMFSVVDKEGNESLFEIHTDKTTVGDALLEVGLIEGENSEYGLYVKTVNGIVADYEVDQTYWAFYVNGEYAMAGVDATPITSGESYSFKVEK